MTPRGRAKSTDSPISKGGPSSGGYAQDIPPQALQRLLAGVKLTAIRSGVIFRLVRPEAGVDDFKTFMKACLPSAALAREDLPQLFSKYGPEKFNLNDRGYLAHVHPLELWLLNYREKHPRASLTEVVSRGAAQRRDVYDWLYKTRYKHAEDKRIETLLEVDAFKQIHTAWKKLGYLFDAPTPSYPTCIGVSGDTPQALAMLVGILLNDRIGYPSVRIESLHFADATPFETTLTRLPTAGVRLLSPEIARLARREMVGVVENGTGIRARGGMRLPNGVVLPIGGKTGTGDNRVEVEKCISLRVYSRCGQRRRVLWRTLRSLALRSPRRSVSRSTT